MKLYKVLTVFNHDIFVYCFDDINLLFNFIKYRCDNENTFYIETKWLSCEMIKKLNISYITA